MNTPDGWKVRPATVADARAIAEVHVRSWQVAYKGLVPNSYITSLSVDGREKTWHQKILDLTPPFSAVDLLEKNHQISGFVSVAPSQDLDALAGTGELGSMYLLPTVWGQGGGRMLMAAALSHFRQAGWASTTLWVLLHNTRARRFYEASGWRVDNQQRLAHRGGVEQVEIRYRLRPPDCPT